MLVICNIVISCNKSFPNQSPKIFNKNIYKKTIINMIKKNGDAFSRTDRKNGEHNWSESLFLCCFTSHLRIFRSYSDVRGCKIYTYAQHLGLHARRDLYRATSVVTGPSGFRFFNRRTAPFSRLGYSEPEGLYRLEC